jgi:hypothetical protein
MKRQILAVVIGTVAFAAPAFASPKEEVTTAALHAGLAAKGGDIKEVHTHLHHALNCLVGPDGQGYDAKEMDPCKQIGKGAIPDTSDASVKKSLEAAAASASAGIAETDLAKAQKTAAQTESMLKAIK